jgi:sialate O-acetylesterase
MKKGLLLYICITCLTIIGTAQTKLPLFFANGMVLQRNANATIWGTDAANRKVIVTGSWGKTDSVITNLAGKWKLTLETPAAGGPYTLTATGNTTVVINDILMGEVWLCSGQSNMEMPMKGYTASTPPQPVDSSAYFIANSLNPNLRVFTSGWNGTSTTPVDDLSVGSWKSASPTNTPDFSATAYFFARKLQEKLGVPVGIMVTARGGASIESWMDSATLATVKPVVIPNPVNWQTAQTTHTILYNTMLHPFIGYTLKGIIWSQGEANRANHFEYQEMLTKLIQSWRVKWNLGAFPFYFAEVAPNGGTANQNAAYLREAQLNTMLTTGATGMASTMDIGVQGLDHYPKKKVIGDRLAEWALIKNYGQTYGTTSGPVVKSMTIRNDTINIKFDYVGIGLVAGGSGLTDFEIAGANRVFYPAIATIANDGMSVNVKSTSVASPLYVNYAFKNFVVGSLFNSDGLPAPSFRVENVITVLPIKFGNISATQKNGERTIVWNTLTESNIDHFELQHSTDGNNFSFLTKVMAKNTSANYKYEDKQNHNNQVVYYRIKVHHTNGSSTYSSIVKSTIFDKANVVKFINPSYNGVSVFFPTAFTGSIVITDNLGRKIAVKQINHHFGLFNTPLPKAFKGTAVVQLNTTDHKMHSAIIHVL